MQQRYYDPGIGMFLSVDSVTAYSNPIGQFHRYRYANNNPYKFTDPDGRAAVCLIPGVMQACIAAAVATAKLVVEGVVIAGAVIAIAAPVIIESEGESGPDAPGDLVGESDGRSRQQGWANPDFQLQHQAPFDEASNDIN